MRWKILVFVLLVASVLSYFGSASFSQAADKPSRKIVVFKSSVTQDANQENLINRSGGSSIKKLGIINAKVVNFPNQAAERALSKRSQVLRMDDDIIIDAVARTPYIQPAQVMSWGIKDVNANPAWAATRGSGIKVGVIDTGIDLSHPDLAANIKGGYNAIRPTRSANDDNGHGTHVAGIIAAIDNTIGVVGISPQADLYAIKVLNSSGSGYLSDIIEGMDWSIANHMQVINMSFGTSSNVQSFHDAVMRVNNVGIVQVAAAGNSGGGVIYPAAYPEVIAVSAVDSTNTIAGWSSRGSQVALSAPGVDIYSTYRGSVYRTLSGTSMAAPHVSAVAALALEEPVGSYDLDSNGIWSPTELENKLEATATDLGISGKDALYGAGLVNAFAAVAP